MPQTWRLKENSKTIQTQANVQSRNAVDSKVDPLLWLLQSTA